MTNENKLSIHDKKRIRTGKTAKDHSSGAWARTTSNRIARANWSNDPRGKNNDPVFKETCHGKGNSSKAKKIKPARAA